MSNLVCHNSYWDGQDWDECFRNRILNTAVPLAAVSLSAGSLIYHSVRRSRGLAASVENVAKLDPAASSFSQVNAGQDQRGALSFSAAARRNSFSESNRKRRGFFGRVIGYILPWNSSRLLPSYASNDVQDDEDTAASQAALEVFRTENAVILNEVHQTPLDSLDEQALQKLRRYELIRRLVEVSGSIILTSLHAAAAVMGWSQFSWEAWWGGLWVYISLLGAFSLSTGHSLFTHKATLMAFYFVINLFNLRTALIKYYAEPNPLTRDLMIVIAAQVVTTLAVLVPTFFFPLQSLPPRDLRAIYYTISPEKEHGVPGTAVPSPIIRPADAAHQGGANGAQGDPTNGAADPEARENETPKLIPPPEDTASLYSRAVFGFVTPVIRKHFKIQFTMPAVPDLPVADKAAAVVAVFRAYTSTDPETTRSSNTSRKSKSKDISDKLKPSTKPLWIRLFKHFAAMLVIQFFWAALEATLVLSPAFFLNKILAFITERGERQREGNMEGATPLHVAILYAFGMLFGQIMASVSASQALFMGRRICIRLRAILITEIVTKTLRRKDSGGSKKKEGESQGEGEDGKPAQAEESSTNRATDGQVVNLISVDVFKVSEICAYLHFLAPKAPLTIGLCLAYLISLLGWSAVLGVLVLFASVPLQAFVSQWFVKLQRQLLETTDKRLNLATEVLGCIKTVKFFAWEDSFNQRMDETRQKELHVLYRRFLAWLVNTFTYLGTPMLVTCATFGTHTKLFHKPLTAETAFTALALFNTLRNPLDALPDMIVQILNSLVSVRRIDSYLREEETNKYQQLLTKQNEEVSSEDPVVGFQDASFCYTDDDEAVEAGAFALKDVNLNLPVGKLTVIAGPVGSGKTTLLLSLLGETRQLSGKTSMPCPVARALAPVDPANGLSESVAYCSQSPWLLASTLKENILFGSKYDHQRYRAVIKACALEPDLKILEYGDETEVGEKGTSLSGGQKARIALARAFYSSARHILIDDALSAVDSHTAKHLYTHALKGALSKGRTVLLVTHAISLCLPGAAFAVAMDDGRVVAAGTPDVVNATGVFSDEGVSLQDSLKRNGHADGDAEEELTIEQLAAGGTEAADREEMKKLEKKKAYANEETYASGSVGTKTYGLYLGSISPKMRVVFGLWLSLLVFFVAVRMLDLGAGAWLMRWAGSHDNERSSASSISAIGMKEDAHITSAPVVSSPWSSAVGSMRSFHLDSYLIRPSGQAQHNHSKQQQRTIPTILPRTLSPKQFAFNADVAPASPSDDPVLAFDVEATRERTPGELDTYYLLVYLAISLGFMFACIFRDGYEFYISLKASRSMYRRLMSAILNAKPQFFDRTPVGRIMNRLSKDIETVDQEMAVCLLFLLDCMLTCSAILLLICWATPAFIFAAVIIVGIYYMIGVLYLVSSRDLKRIESVERSPIYTVVGEVLAGSVTIRAYGDAGRFTRHCLRLIDKANRAFFFLWYENRWLSVRVDVAGAFVAFLSAVFLLLRPDIEASLAGFILAYAITFVDSVLWIVRMYTQTEINMNSVERIGEYLDLEPENQDGVEPPAYWPSSEGSIVVDNLSVRYTPEFPRVLSGVNLEIKPREKVGIVGRTGSGKSTLALCLFRFLEAEEGAIVIDGIDISKIPMKTLRQRLTVIPQDAQLFSGTVRSNLDPFNMYEDGELWTALQRCRLASFDTPAASRAVSRPSSPPPASGSSEPDLELSGRTNVISSLDAPVEQGGRNFSAGQKQLLALARGLLKLRDSRILLLDESTANLDSASDAQIQKTIRQEMAPQATIITIAHRIKTIADYDKICVLDKGKVIEFASPNELMKKEEGVFRSMCEQSGEMAQLKKLAEEADKKRASF